MRKEVIGNAVLYLGDAREVLTTLGPVNAVVTDPPYGVGLGERDNNNRHRDHYEGFEDTPLYIQEAVLPSLRVALGRAERGLVTCGVRNLRAYLAEEPIPDHIGSIYYPAAAGCNVWGFSNWQPMLYYGKDPHGGFGSLHDSFTSTEAAEKNGHPCPKPLRQMIWMVNRVSRERSDTILDLFMGSGTTGVACMNLGRKFIGVELHKPYFDIACERLTNAQRQERMFA